MRFFADRAGVCPAFGKGPGFPVPAALAPVFAAALFAAGLDPDFNTLLSIVSTPYCPPTSGGHSRKCARPVLFANE